MVTCQFTIHIPKFWIPQDSQTAHSVISWLTLLSAYGLSPFILGTERASVAIQSLVATGDGEKAG